MLSKVVFPEPELPMINRNSPFLTVKAALLSAVIFVSPSP